MLVPVQQVLCVVLTANVSCVVSVVRYSHKMPLWVNTVTERFANVTVTEERFQAARTLFVQVGSLPWALNTLRSVQELLCYSRWWRALAGLPQDMRNVKYGQVYQQAQRQLRLLMRTTLYTPAELAEAAGNDRLMSGMSASRPVLGCLWCCLWYLVTFR